MSVIEKKQTKQNIKDFSDQQKTHSKLKLVGGFNPSPKNLCQIGSFPHVNTWKPPIGMNLKEGQILSSVRPFSTWVPELLLCQKLAKHLCLELRKNQKKHNNRNNLTSVINLRDGDHSHRIHGTAHIWTILLWMSVNIAFMGFSQKMSLQAKVNLIYSSQDAL